jgi:hypothetical protein
MLRRMLFIGIGGSGGKTLRFIRRDLDWQLRRRGWVHGLPRGWQFLHIDVPTIPDGNDADLPPQLPAAQYLGLATKGTTFNTLDSTLVPHNASERLLEGCIGWRPNPLLATNIDPTVGAGQYRAIGRAIAVTRIATIRDRINERVAELQSHGSVEQLNEVAALFGAVADGPTPPPMAVVVSSMSGGSGAGSFLDVCNVLQAEGDWRASCLALLFTPDVFGSLGGAASGGIQANALASISELLASYWWNREEANPDADLYQPAGITRDAFRKIGPRYPFIVGASNGSVQFSGQQSMYAAVGSALAALAASEIAQDQFSAYLLGNWFQAADEVADNLRWKLKPGGETPLSSLGFARVGMGRDRFARYAAERLARGAVERILRGHWNQEVYSGNLTAEAALAEAANRRFEGFLAASHLNERGKEHDDVITALRPEGREASLNEVVRKVRSDAVGDSPTGLRPADLAGRMIGSFELFTRSFAAEDTAAMRVRAQTWCDEMPERIVRVVAEEIGVSGGYVAVELIDRLIAETIEVAGQLNVGERQQFEHWATKLDEAVRGELDKFDGEYMQPNNPQIEQAVRRGSKTLEWKQEAVLCGLASELMIDLAHNFLRPLNQFLRVALDNLATEDQPREGADHSVIRQWPEPDKAYVPPGFRPAENERLVDQVSEFPEIFDEKLVATFTVDGRKPLAGPSRDRAVAEIVAGSADVIGLGAPIRSSGWVPKALGQAAKTAQFEIDLTATDLLTRAQTWVRIPNSVLGVYTAESLRDYLDATKAGAEIGAREARFRDAFSEALSLSRPLVDIDNALASAIHDLSEVEVRYIVSEIPLGGLPIWDRLDEVLAAANLNAVQRGAFSEALTQGAQQEIEIITALKHPMHAPVFRSLMAPIAQNWRQQDSESDRASFWHWRRSRPLAGAVPVRSADRTDMVRGWFLARALGQLEWDPDFQEPVRIYDSVQQRWRNFPHPLLVVDVVHDRELLPAVLESMPLVMLEISEQRTTEPIEPYWWLRDYGTNARKYVRRWIDRGEITNGASPPSAVLPQAARAGQSAGPTDERRDLLVTWFKNRQHLYVEQHCAQPMTVQGFFEQPSIRELRTDVVAAFESLILFASEATVDVERD